MKTLARPALRSAATSISTMAGVRIRALTERHPIKPTSPRCHSAWQLNLGRHSTYRRGKSVQTTGTTSVTGSAQEMSALVTGLPGTWITLRRLTGAFRLLSWSLLLLSSAATAVIATAITAPARLVVAKPRYARRRTSFNMMSSPSNEPFHTRAHQAVLIVYENFNRRKFVAWG